MAYATDGDEGAGRADPERHPDLTRVAGEMRAAWREEQEAATADAAAHWRHTRGLNDWLRDRMHAGDVVVVTVPARRFEGRIEEVGPDLVALRCAHGLVEIQLNVAIPTAFELVEHATKGGTRSSMHRTFRDALLARDTQADVIVATVLQPAGVAGTILVGRDVVTVVEAAGTETVVPLAQVAWVAPSRP